MKRNYMPPSCVAYHIEPSALIAESKVKDSSKENKLDTEDILTKKSDNWNVWGDDDDE